MMKRRTFLKSAAIGTGALVSPTVKLFGKDAPSNKLNIALIGVWGRGLAHQNVAARENVVALCDVNDNYIALAAKKFPKAKTYNDWRKCLDQKDVDAVICATTDHTHAFVGNWALNRDLHIYLEKPMGNTVEEARTVHANYLKRKNKVATQLGTQRHAAGNFRRLREMIKDGAIGDVKAAYAWGNRKLPKPGYLPAAGDPPAHLHYDLWIGPSQHHPYNPEYFKARPGAGCLQWNMYWDFGTGQIGDMGAHTMDLAWNCLDAGHPTSATASGDAYNPSVTPVKLEMHMEHPANEWRGPITVSWYQGGALPSSPSRWVDLKKIGHGAMFKGTKGFIVADFGRRLLIPFGDGADMTYYKPRKKEDLVPPLGGFQEEWVRAAKGDPTKTSCNFDYSGLMTEQMMLGLAAYRAGKKLEYDGAKGVVTNDTDANNYLGKVYRKGWTLNG